TLSAPWPRTATSPRSAVCGPRPPSQRNRLHDPMSSSPIQSSTDYKFSHALTGPYLPPPGKAPGWPFAGIGQWMIDVNAASENWIRGLREWRQEHLFRIGFDDLIYGRARVQWRQGNFVHVQVIVADRD